MKEFAADDDVIHVTIDRSSLQQLTKLSDHDIKQDENVKLVTSKKEGQQFADYLQGQKSVSSGKGFPSSPKNTHSTHFKLAEGAKETMSFNPDLY